MRYRTIVADPPWPIGDPRRRLRMGAGGRRRRSTDIGYDLMSLDAIRALPVAMLAEDEAHLYLWTTAGFHRTGAAIDIAEAWGFRCVGEIVWAKANFGLGAFPRPAHEVLLVCKRGRLPFALRNVGSVQHWKQSYENNGGKRHSAKPEGAIDLIERASPGPYLELFARRNRLGWDTWGRECLVHVAVGPQPERTGT